MDQRPGAFRRLIQATGNKMFHRRHLSHRYKGDWQDFREVINTEFPRGIGFESCVGELHRSSNYEISFASGEPVSLSRWMYFSSL